MGKGQQWTDVSETISGKSWWEVKKESMTIIHFFKYMGTSGIKSIFKKADELNLGK